MINIDFLDPVVERYDAAIHQGPRVSLTPQALKKINLVMKSLEGLCQIAQFNEQKQYFKHIGFGLGWILTRDKSVLYANDALGWINKHLVLIITPLTLGVNYTLKAGTIAMHKLDTNVIFGRLNRVFQGALTTLSVLSVWKAIDDLNSGISELRQATHTTSRTHYVRSSAVIVKAISEIASGILVNTLSGPALGGMTLIAVGAELTKNWAESRIAQA